MIQYGAPIDPAWAPAMAPRDNCPEPRELCTGPVMLHGTGMTLTYLCPQTSDAVSTVHVTVTATTIVTLAPAPAEPTTTTTIQSTATQYKTLTVTRKKDTTCQIPVSTPTTRSEVHATPSSSQVITTAFMLLPPFRSSSVSSAMTYISIPCMDCTFDWLLPIPRLTNGTTSKVHSSRTVSASSVVNALPISHNATSTIGYRFPTIHAIRDVESARTSKTGGADQKNVSVTVLFLAMVVAACFA
jgi:hypothetical protein